VSFSALLEKENRLLELDFCDEFYCDEYNLFYVRFGWLGVDAHPPGSAWISHCPSRYQVR